MNVVENKKSHPSAGKKMMGADMIVQILADENVDTIFGYSGGAILPTYDAVFRFNNENKDEIIDKLAIYFEEFYKFCFELNDNIVLKGEIKFKY